MDTKAKHTPLPWRVFTTKDGRKLIGVGGEDGEGILDSGFGVWSWMHADGIANADFIVRACNAHDDLVEAVESLSAQLRKRECSIKDCKVLDQADAALAKAGAQS